ncbi:MAG: lytic transglycosylase domain-containing protein [Nitrospinae bacterium]|nr:lytic transglycosylase domain-containing protein [Nitrospinota bacterium]
MAEEADRKETAYVDTLYRLHLAWRENRILKTVNLNERSKSLSEDEKNRLAKTVSECSKLNGHDPFLLLALIEVESGYDGRAVSEKGAMGLLQVRPFVAREMAGELDISFPNDNGLHDMETNVKIGSYYLAKMMRRYGDLTMALEAYNLGPAKLDTLVEEGRLKKRFTKRTLKVRDRLRKLAPQIPA